MKIVCQMSNVQQLRCVVGWHKSVSLAPCTSRGAFKATSNGFRQAKAERRSRRSPMQLVALRMHDLAKLFRSRYGIELPDDDAGRDDMDVALNHLACLPHPMPAIKAMARDMGAMAHRWQNSATLPRRSWPTRNDGKPMRSPGACGSQWSKGQCWESPRSAPST
jgi:hypothetical protein